MVLLQMALTVDHDGTRLIMRVSTMNHENMHCINHEGEDADDKDWIDHDSMDRIDHDSAYVSQMMNHLDMVQ